MIAILCMQIHKLGLMSKACRKERDKNSEVWSEAFNVKIQIHMSL